MTGDRFAVNGRVNQREPGAQATPCGSASPPVTAVPVRRLRRLRRNEGLRSLRRETRLSPAQLVQPLFVVESPRDQGAIRSMPGIGRMTIDAVADTARSLEEAGVGAALLFGIPATKSPDGAAAADPDGVVPRALRAMRAAAPSLPIITDVCLCGFTDHGHCGLICNGEILNDASLERMARIACVHAAAGADLVAPSGMLDGGVGAIRAALDGAGHGHVGILAYTVKYASAWYGPFREALDSSPRFGDRRSHQIDVANGDEALEEARLDLEEGADILMVKPALPALDVVRRLRERFTGVPIAAYQVSGEYASIVAAGERGWLDADTAAREALVSIARAGADIIVTYFAERVARWLRDVEGATA